MGLGVWGQQIQTVINRMGKQQGPAAEDRQLYPISWDQPSWKITWKRVFL